MRIVLEVVVNLCSFWCYITVGAYREHGNSVGVVIVMILRRGHPVVIAWRRKSTRTKVARRVYIEDRKELGGVHADGSSSWT